MGQSNFTENLFINGYTLGAFGYTKDLSKEFHKKQKKIEERKLIFQLNDPTPKNYDILDDLDLLMLFSEQCGRGIFSR